MKDKVLGIDEAAALTDLAALEYERDEAPAEPLAAAVDHLAGIVRKTSNRHPSRPLDLFDLLCWVYRDQKAHRYLARTIDWFDWAIDRTTSETDKNIPIHFDAAVVHAAVIGLGEADARLIVEYANIAERPIWPSHLPQPMPSPMARMTRADDKPMRFIGPAPTRGAKVQNAADIKVTRLAGAPARTARASYFMRNMGNIIETEYVEKRVHRKGPKRVQVVEKQRSVPVWFCPIEYDPDPAFVELLQEIYRGWIDAMARLLLALGDETLREHSVVGFDFEPAPPRDDDMVMSAPLRSEQRAIYERSDRVIEHLDRDQLQVKRMRLVATARLKKPRLGELKTIP